MEKKGWKILAIILLILFIGENLLFFWAYSYNAKIEEKTMECYYEICEQYPEATLDGDLCTCYDYDLLGEFTIAKTKWMK